MEGKITGVAIPQRMVMSALNNRDRINLDVTKMLNSRQGGRNCTADLLFGRQSLRQ